MEDLIKQQILKKTILLLYMETKGRTRLLGKRLFICITEELNFRLTE